MTAHTSITVSAAGDIRNGDVITVHGEHVRPRWYRRLFHWWTETPLPLQQFVVTRVDDYNLTYTRRSLWHHALALDCQIATAPGRMIENIIDAYVGRKNAARR